jgi:hypothetical protein
LDGSYSLRLSKLGTESDKILEGTMILEQNVPRGSSLAYATGWTTIRLSGQTSSEDYLP